MSKPNLIIIHGFLQSFSCFPKFIEDLKPHFNILLIDLPGYGKNNNTNINDIEQYLEFIYQEITSSYKLNINRKINLLGWSLGGNISILLANKYPEFFNKLFLLCSNPCFVKSNSNNYGMNKDIFLNFYNNIQSNIKKTSDKFLKLQLLGLDKDEFKKQYLNLKKFFESQKIPNIETLVFNLKLLNKDIRPILENINNEIYYILAEKDNLIPIEILEYFQDIKKDQDKLFIIPNATHVPMLTNKDMLQSYLFEFG